MRQTSWYICFHSARGSTKTSIVSRFSAPSFGLGAASVFAMNQALPWRYSVFSPFADTAKPLMPLRNGSVFRVFKSNLVTVTGLIGSKRGTSAIRDEDIGRFDVTVNDPLRMGSIQCVGNLDGQLQQLLRVERPAGNAVLERLALQKLHDNKVLALVFINLMDGTDVGVIQGGGGASFTLEPLHRITVLGKLFRQEFQSYQTAEPGVFCLVHHAHPAATEFFQDAVMRDCLA